MNIVKIHILFSYEEYIKNIAEYYCFVTKIILPKRTFSNYKCEKKKVFKL